MSEQGQTQGAGGTPTTTRLTQEDLKHHSQELGMLGSIFGSRENAPYYIAAVALLGALCLLGYVIIVQPQNSAGMTLLGAIVTGSLGYIFGKSGKN